MRKNEKIEALLLEAETIQSFLESEYGDSPQELSERLTTLGAYMARTGKMLADAKLLRDEAMNSAYTEYSKAVLKMPATVANKFISSVTTEENYMVNWLDRINRICVHQADSMRTQISFAKNELSFIKTGY